MGREPRRPGRVHLPGRRAFPGRVGSPRSPLRAVALPRTGLLRRAHAERHRPRGPRRTASVVDAAGRVWFAATGRSYIGRLDPADRRVDEFALPSILDAGLERPTPWALALSRRQGRVWSALHSSGKIASVAVDATPVHRGFV